MFHRTRRRRQEFSFSVLYFHQHFRQQSTAFHWHFIFIFLFVIIVLISGEKKDTIKLANHNNIDEDDEFFRKFNFFNFNLCLFVTFKKTTLVYT